jgi:AcrR family transcriptional regulator
MILSIENAIPKPEAVASSDVADRIVRRSLAKREGEYASEVRRLLDAALEVMQGYGTSARPRVADIVAASGLSNDAFYRHFKSKDDLVTALLEDGGERLRSYLEHQLAKETTPEGKVRRWVEGVLAQAVGDVAAGTLAVMWNGGTAGAGLAAGRHFASSPVATLLHQPFAALGSSAPELDAMLAAHATFGMLSDFLWEGVEPTEVEVERVTAFCLAAVTPAVSGAVRLSRTVQAPSSAHASP